MGQIYNACIYDIESRICHVEYADKFTANCYSCVSTVSSTHYLLRQKPHYVLWCGDNMLGDDDLAYVQNENVLLGISTVFDYDIFAANDKELSEKPFHDKAKFIGENYKTWKHIDISDEAWDYFDMGSKHSVPYVGYLLNHTKKLAVDLADYHEKSKFFGDKRVTSIWAVDLLPVLTDIGGGSALIFFRGVSAESTIELAGSWRGCLLQITDDLPVGYEVIKCAFVDIWRRSEYCYKTFGIDDEGFIKDGDSLFEVSTLSGGAVRGITRHVKAEINGDELKLSTVAKE